MKNEKYKLERTQNIPILNVSPTNDWKFERPVIIDYAYMLGICIKKWGFAE